MGASMLAAAGDVGYGRKGETVSGGPLVAREYKRGVNPLRFRRPGFT